MEKKKKNVLKIIFFAAAALTGAGLILFSIMFSPSRIKNILENAAAETFRMRVTIEDATLRPGILSLKNIDLEPLDPQDDLPRISVRKISLGFRILPLFRREFVFNSINIKEPDISVDKVSAGAVEDFLRKQLPDTGRNGIRFFLTSMRVSDGIIRVREPDVELSAFQFSGKVSVLSRSFNFSAGADIGVDYIEKAHIDGEIDLLRDLVRIETVSLTGMGGSVEGSGRINDLLTAPHAEIRYRVDEFPRDFLFEKIEFEGTPSIRGDLEQKRGNLYLNWNADFTDVEMALEEKFFKPDGLRLRSRGGISITPETTSINWYVLEAGQETVSGTGLIEDTGALEINIRADNINLENIGEIFPEVEKYAAGGYGDIRGTAYAASGHAVFDGSASLRNLRVRNLPALSGLYDRLTRSHRPEFLFETVDLEAVIDTDKFILNSLTATGPDLRGTGSGSLIWGEAVNFTFYPIIMGSRIGIRVFGSPDDVRISLQ